MGRLYDNTKVAKELMVEAYQRLYGFEVIVLRLAKCSRPCTRPPTPWW